MIRKQLTKNSACYYYNIVATFDIETTTIEPNYTIKIVNKKKNKTKNINIRIEETLLNEFKNTCEVNLQNPSKVIRSLVKEYINKSNMTS